MEAEDPECSIERRDPLHLILAPVPPLPSSYNLVTPIPAPTTDSLGQVGIARSISKVAALPFLQAALAKGLPMECCMHCCQTF